MSPSTAGDQAPAPLHVVARGAGNAGPLVVLVHGSMDRSAGMARVAGRLRDLHVVRYDRRGYGRSRDAGSGVDLAGHVADLVGVIADHAADGQPVVVVGHSYGGVVAMTAAARHRGLVTAIASFEAPLPWLAWWPGSRTARQGPGARPADTEDPDEAVDAFLRRMLGDERWAAMPAGTKRDRRLEGPALLADMRSLRSGAAPFDLATLGVPVVAGYGTLSGSHQQRGAALLSEMTGGEVVPVAGAHHGAHLTHPAAFADVARRALARA